MKKKNLLILTVLILVLLPVSSSLAAYWRVNTTWLKARSEPSYSGTVEDSYRRDFAVSLISKYKGGWAKVRFLPSGNIAYVQSKYLKQTKSYFAYISKESTLLRSGPSTSFQAIGKLNLGTKVTVLTHGSAFDYVSTSAGKGYIRNSCLTTTKPSKGSIPKYAQIKNPKNRTVNLRKGPGKNYKVLAEYRPGTKVTILKKGSVWCKVKIGSRSGYMMTQYLSFE